MSSIRPTDTYTYLILVEELPSTHLGSMGSSSACIPSVETAFLLAVAPSLGRVGSSELDELPQANQNF